MQTAKHVLVLLLSTLLCVQSILGMDFGFLEEPDFVPACEGRDPQLFPCEGLLEGAIVQDPAISSPALKQDLSLSGEEQDLSFSEEEQEQIETPFFFGEEEPGPDFSSQEREAEELSPESEEPPSEMAYLITIPRIVVQGGEISLSEEIQRLEEAGAIAAQAAEIESLPEAVYAGDNSFSTIAECGSFVREPMKNRVDSFRFSLKNSDVYPDHSHWESILEKATERTGIGNEGDYIERSVYSYSGEIAFSSVNGYSFAYTVKYYTNASQEAEVTRKLNQVYTDLQLSSLSTPYQKIRAVYDYICDHLTYDDDHLDDCTYLLQYTPYAGLILGTCVCQGYGVLLYRMLLDNGISCRCIQGNEHLWNIVEIYGKYYNVDVTWDDQSVRTYRYFLKCNSSFPNHERLSQFHTEAFHAAYPMSPTNYTGEETPTNAPTPTSTPTQRPSFRPEPNSQEDGFHVKGPEFPFVSPEAFYGSFEVYGASAENRYADKLIYGDIKWSPYGWGTTDGELLQTPEEESCASSQIYEIVLTPDQYFAAKSYTLLLYFKAYEWDGSKRRATMEVSSLSFTFPTTSITPTPTQPPAQTPTTAPQESLALSAAQLTLYAGAGKAYSSARLTTNSLSDSRKFTSSNKKVAKASSKGTVTAVKAGEATITVTIPGLDLSATCHVTMLHPTLEVTDSIQLKRKQKTTLEVYAYPPGSITFKSSKNL